MNIDIKTFPVEIILNICECVYIIDDLICLYKTCKFMKNIIDIYKIQILLKLFKSETFSNSYYNLFYSFINNRYELTKDEPYLNLKTLLEWNPEYILDKRDNRYSEYTNTKICLVNFFLEKEKLQKSHVDGSFDIFKNFMYLMFMPTKYIYTSELLCKHLNIRGLASKYKGQIMIQLQKDLYYLHSNNKETPLYTIYPDFRNDDMIFENLIKIYPDILVNHIINFRTFVSRKIFKRIIHNFLINLFLEWLFDNECEFIETIYYKIYLHIPDLVQKIIYRIIYADFEIKYEIGSDEFVEEFYEIHRIFLPRSKIIGLYNRLKLWEYDNIKNEKVNSLH